MTKIGGVKLSNVHEIEWHKEIQSPEIPFIPDSIDVACDLWFDAVKQPLVMSFSSIYLFFILILRNKCKCYFQMMQLFLLFFQKISFCAKNQGIHGSQ